MGSDGEYFEHEGLWLAVNPDAPIKLAPGTGGGCLKVNVPTRPWLLGDRKLMLEIGGTVLQPHDTHGTKEDA